MRIELTYRFDDDNEEEEDKKKRYVMRDTTFIRRK